ncbi:replication protein [Apilactobacillus micheneri]|uniref:conserved phage C-terminal domain-containing protein n=1 Tax=Apilactobacillus micheneri TaxID=1899430 RepID=UPI00112CDEA2|nr:conserved phage C-terminal domain-containing protein [Apilactobacillus micheneri]TPR43183.1 replication protein [Apilactobacillus micheneri]TPR46986.1 replication protein [Apilactobacillus micheneri]
MNNLLFDKKPLVVSTPLAEEIGLNEAIVLQQLHYWLQRSNHKINGRIWIYNSYDAWQEQFPFWNVRTVKRVITKLKNQGIIIVDRFNRAGFDKTNWYTINYEKFNLLVSQRLGQNVPTRVTNCPNGEGQNVPTDTREYTEITSESTTNHKSSSKTEHDHTAAKEVIAYLNEKTGKHYRNTSSNCRMIEPRLKDYSVDDLKHVVDIKCSQWINDSKMNKFLRPATLFQASKIDGYLNENPKNNSSGGETYGAEF